MSESLRLIPANLSEARARLAPPPVRKPSALEPLAAAALAAAAALLTAWVVILGPGEIGAGRHGEPVSVELGLPGAVARRRPQSSGPLRVQRPRRRSTSP